MRKIITIFTITIVVVLLIWLIVGLTKEKKDKEVIMNKQDEVEDDEMKKDFDKVEKFEPDLNADREKENELTFTLEETENITASTKEFKYVLSNEGTGNEVLSFTTSQDYEYDLTNLTNGTITRFSDGKNFLQVMKDIEVVSGEELDYIISVPISEPGEYSLTVYSAARGMSDSKKTILFSISK